MNEITKPIYVSGMLSNEAADALRKKVVAAIETPERIRQRISGYHQLEQINMMLELLESSLPPILTPAAAEAMGMQPGQILAPVVQLTTQELAAIRISLDMRKNLLDKKLPALKQQDHSDFVDPNAQSDEEVEAMQKAELETRFRHLMSQMAHQLPGPDMTDVIDPPDELPDFLL